MFVKTRGTMELARRISLCFIGVMISFSVIAQDQRATFSEKLRLQEKLEREQLEQMIETASAAEYRLYLRDQLSLAMKSAGTNTATVIIDVTDMQSATTALKRSGDISLGAMKLISLMAQAPLAKHNSVDTSNTDLTITNKQWEFSNDAGNQQFEQVNVELGNVAIETLLNSSDVKDVFITSGSQYGSKYSAINTELGRFYPPVVAKVYDEEFLREGYLNELMVVFDSQKTALVSVTLRGYPDTSLSSDYDNRRDNQVADEVLSTLNPDDYELESKAAFCFLIQANKIAVEQLSKDDRVDMISEETSNITIID
jgi:hypothetical protein